MTREYHSLKRERDRLLREIEANGHRGQTWAMGQLARCEQLSARMNEIRREAGKGSK